MENFIDLTNNVVRTALSLYCHSFEGKLENNMVVKFLFLLPHTPNPQLGRNEPQLSTFLQDATKGSH
jgi:hypothetical protein